MPDPLARPRWPGTWRACGGSPRVDDAYYSPTSARALGRAPKARFAAEA